MVGIDIGENSLFPGPDDPIYEVVDNGEPGAGNDMLRGTFLPTAQTDCPTYPFLATGAAAERCSRWLTTWFGRGSRRGRPRPSDAIAGPAPLLHDSHASGGGRLTEALFELGENYSVGPHRIQDAA